MMRYNIALVCILLSLSVYPSISISRWFSSTYHDLRFSLRRFGHCVGDLQPLKDSSYNETEYLIHQIRVFLDQTNYDNEQMANISLLMDNICRVDVDYNYPISSHVNMALYNGTSGKENRCRAIDEALDSMFVVFKRAALNKSEPLDFSTILFYPNSTDKEVFYNLTDLINTSWIKSDYSLENTCKITDAVKEYVAVRSSNSSAQDRSQQQHSSASYLRSLIEFVEGLLDPILGARKRLYWESTNRLELLQLRVSNQLGNLRDGIGKGYRSTIDLVSNLLPRGSTNSTTNLNGTVKGQKLNSSQPIELAVNPKSVAINST